MQMFVSKPTRAEYIFWAINVKSFILSNNFFTIQAQNNEEKHSWGWKILRKYYVKLFLSLKKRAISNIISDSIWQPKTSISLWISEYPKVK